MISLNYELSYGLLTFENGRKIRPTHDGNAPALMTGLYSLSKIVLGNVKIPTEHAAHIAPFLQKLQKGFGTPQACVHDIGKDFLEPAYSSLRSFLRKHRHVVIGFCIFHDIVDNAGQTQR